MNYTKSMYLPKCVNESKNFYVLSDVISSKLMT